MPAKKHLVLSTLALTLTACAPPPSAPDAQKTADFLSGLRYARDAHGNCYAFRENYTYMQHYVYTFSVVPCSREVLAAIPQTPPVAPQRESPSDPRTEGDRPEQPAGSFG